MIPSHDIDDILRAHFKRNDEVCAQKCLDEILSIFNNIHPEEVICSHKVSMEITKQDENFMGDFEQLLNKEKIFLEIKG